MARDDLNDPLGMHLANDAALPKHTPWRAIAFSGCGVLGLSLVAFALVMGSGQDGEPFATASILPSKKLDPPAAVAPAQTFNAQDVAGSTSVAKQVSSAEEAEAASGVKVIRRGGGAPPGALIIQVPQALGIQLTPAPDKRLTEKSRFGLLPKMGADGARPADIYARPVVATGVLKPGAPRIALMVGGMGLAQSVTQDAGEKLPGAVTLAFAPYGADLERQVAQARSQGHEVVLQAPMEPFDYPQNDPGPHTLRQGADPAETLDDLRWMLGRFTGYVGVGNFLGARFTANPAALTPVLRDIATRGLIYVDDGTSPQSKVPETARGLGLDVLKADMVLDTDPRPEAMAASLVALEALARKNGSALGVASALPASIDRLARFTRTLEARGIALVPVSALASGLPKASAQRQ